LTPIKINADAEWTCFVNPDLIDMALKIQKQFGLENLFQIKPYADYKTTDENCFLLSKQDDRKNNFKFDDNETPIHFYKIFQDTFVQRNDSIWMRFINTSMSTTSQCQRSITIGNSIIKNYDIKHFYGHYWYEYQDDGKLLQYAKFPTNELKINRSLIERSIKYRLNYIKEDFDINFDYDLIDQEKRYEKPKDIYFRLNAKYIPLHFFPGLVKMISDNFTRSTNNKVSIDLVFPSAPNDGVDFITLTKK
jgi:hypothetical protein